MRFTPKFPLASASRQVFFGLRLLLAAGLIVLGASAVQAIPISEYDKQLRQAVTALDTLALRDETEAVAAYESRSLETVHGVRNLIPQTQTVEWNGLSFRADNSWLHQELDKYGTVMKQERPELLRRITERLQALAERITELQTPGAGNVPTKAEASRKLAEILKRPEYARKVAHQSALARLMKQFVEWLLSLLPKPKPFSAGSAGLLIKIAQLFIIVLALAVLAYVVKLFLPRLLRNRRPKKKTKQQARIVLGEKLEPDQSATDLLSEAEGLARRGELRAAIRKAYIALLVELGDRKIISLAQYKTNRDYLRAVREVQPLYGNVKQLTDSFEQHWYGLAHATESDWLAFRAAYKQALK
jgi:uncharacterized protein DUF4129